MTFKKYTKKFSRYAKKEARKRYQTKTGGLRINQVVKDVATLKKMINAEKQNVESSNSTTYPLAQYNGVSTAGLQSLNIMPTVSQGFSEDQRKGDSLKICSWVLKLQVFNNGADTISGQNYTFYLLRQPINPQSGVAASFLETNPFSGVLDYHSNRDYQHYKDYIVMGTVKGKLVANTTGSATQGFKTNVHTLARKQEFHIRYDKGTTDILNNNITLLAVSSDGDRSTDNKIFFKYSFKTFFYDN